MVVPTAIVWLVPFGDNDCGLHLRLGADIPVRAGSLPTHDSNRWTAFSSTPTSSLLPTGRSLPCDDYGRPREPSCSPRGTPSLRRDGTWRRRNNRVG